MRLINFDTYENQSYNSYSALFNIYNRPELKIIHNKITLSIKKIESSCNSGSGVVYSDRILISVLDFTIDKPIIANSSEMNINNVKNLLDLSLDIFIGYSGYEGDTSEVYKSIISWIEEKINEKIVKDIIE